MRLQVLTVLGMLTLVAADDRRDGGGIKDEVARLQGTWVLHSVECAGEVTEQDKPLDDRDYWEEYRYRVPERRLLESELVAARTTLTIRGDHYAFRQGGRVTAKGKYRLDLSKTPKVMQREGGRFGRYCCNDGCFFFTDDVRTSCIYSLERDCLKWCIDLSGDKVPDDFSAKDNEDICIFVFRRE
jgi:uncharacterized protein (TIGR03067 family)